MLRMRLTRTGAKKRPSYRVVVADSRAPRDGRHVDILGFYDPMTKPSTVRIDTERAVRWLRHGAQPTERVRILLRHSGVLKAHEEARLADKRARKAAAAGEGGVPGGSASDQAPGAAAAAPADVVSAGIEMRNAGGQAPGAAATPAETGPAAAEGTPSV